MNMRLPWLNLISQNLVAGEWNTKVVNLILSLLSTRLLNTETEELLLDILKICLYVKRHTEATYHPISEPSHAHLWVLLLHPHSDSVTLLLLSLDMVTHTNNVEARHLTPGLLRPAVFHAQQIYFTTAGSMLHQPQVSSPPSPLPHACSLINKTFWKKKEK